MSYVFAIHPYFRQDLTVLHCFQIKDGLEKTDRKIWPQEAFHSYKYENNPVKDEKQYLN